MEKAVISSGAVGVLAASVSNLLATPLGLPIGSQVWPTRSMLKDFPAYVKMMADIGVTRLELCSPIGYGAEFSSLANGKEVARILADHGMKSESSHFTMEELRKTQQKSIDWAKEVGITQIITATLGGGNNPTLDQVKKAAEEYNKIAAVSAAAAAFADFLPRAFFSAPGVPGTRWFCAFWGKTGKSTFSRVPSSRPKIVCATSSTVSFFTSCPQLRQNVRPTRA